MSLRPQDPDLQQRRAADPTANVWVAASAGSGKTKVLTDRVLSLLLSGSRPERLLCVTFTKAAAAEMANRIHGRLASWTVMEDATLAEEIRKLDGRPADAERMIIARRLFAAVLDAPGGLKIQTIHGFCQSVLGRFPLEARISPHFEVLDDRSAEELMLTARDMVLRMARDDTMLRDALAAVTRRVAEDRFGELLRLMSSKRGRLRDLLGGADKSLAAGAVEPVLDRVYHLLDAVSGREEEDVIRDICKTDDEREHALHVIAEAMLTHGSEANIKKAKLVKAWLAAGPDGRIMQFAVYCNVFLTKEGVPPQRGVAVKAVREAEPRFEKLVEAEQTRLMDADAMYRRQATANASAGLIRLGAAILAAYERNKQALARLDYDDLILTTRDLLQSHGAPWVLFKLDGGLDHVLIDEAQDTNPEQWEIVGALVEAFFAPDDAPERPRTVFAVGDRKQSIYSFQGADPEGFGKWRAIFDARARESSTGLREVPMQVSFRSTAPVLDTVDAVFAGPPGSDGVTEDPSQPLKHFAFRDGHYGRVELWPLLTPEDHPEPDAWSLPLAEGSKTDVLERFADGLASRIAAIVGKEVLPARDRLARAGDFLILVRRRSALVGALTRALGRHGVQVAGADRMLLTEEIAVMDLMAFGHVLLLPEDDLQLACLLKSPLVGLSEEQLFDLAYDRGEKSLWVRLCEEARKDPWLARVQKWLRALMDRADTMPPFEIFSLALGEPCPADFGTGELSGRRAMLARLGSEAAEPMAEFLSLSLDHGRSRVPSLQAFLAWVSRGAAEVKRDMEAGDRDQVRIMTVHGAKGLQAPIVILPDTTRVPRDSGSPDLLWAGDGSGASDLPIWSPGKAFREPVCERLLGEARSAREREYRRLLYVAMTRAEDWLIICGQVNKQKPDLGCWYDLVTDGMDRLADLTEEEPFDCGDDWTGTALVLDGSQDVPAKREKAADAAIEPDDAPKWLRASAPAEPKPPRPLTPSAPPTALADPPVRSPLADPHGLRFKRGTLVHRLLQSLPDLPEEERAAAAERFLAQPAHGLDADMQSALAEEALMVLNAPALAGLFGPHSRAEVPLTGLGMPGPDGARAVVSGQVDRLAVLDDQIIVADYKTQRPAPDQVADVPRAYLAQMASYRTLLREVYPDRPVRCILVWTESARPMPLPDDLMDGL